MIMDINIKDLSLITQLELSKTISEYICKYTKAKVEYVICQNNVITKIEK